MNENRKTPVEKTCNIGDTEIKYLHYPCDGPDLLLLHATGFLPWVWHPVAEKLSEKFNIIAPYSAITGFRTEDGGLAGASLRGIFTGYVQNWD
jgi:hypothetical protein